MSDASDKLRAALDHAAKTIGNECVAFVVEQMENGYHTAHQTYDHPDGKPKVKLEGVTHTAIFDRGDLERSIDYNRKRTATGTVTEIGSPMDYAMYVHEGTQRLERRAFIVDGIAKNLDRIAEIARSEIERMLNE